MIPILFLYLDAGSIVLGKTVRNLGEYPYLIVLATAWMSLPSYSSLAVYGSLLYLLVLPSSTFTIQVKSPTKTKLYVRHTTPCLPKTLTSHPTLRPRKELNPRQKPKKP
jgi:hypothetical protein